MYTVRTTFCMHNKYNKDITWIIKYSYQINDLINNFISLWTPISVSRNPQTTSY